MARKAAEAEIQEAAGGGREGHGVMSRTDAIRVMLSEGINTPSMAADEILKRFGPDVSSHHFSATKAWMKSRVASKPGRKPEASARQAVEGYLAPTPKQQAPGEQPELLPAIEAMKPPVESLAKDQAHRIVDLLGCALKPFSSP